LIRAIFVAFCGAAVAACVFPSVTYETRDGADDSTDASVPDETSAAGDGPAADDESAAGEGGLTVEASTETGSGSTDAMADDATETSGRGPVDSTAEAAGDATDDRGVIDARSFDGTDEGEASAEASGVDDGATPDGPGAETGPDGSACDQDGDHDIAPGAVCGGNDCDDHDARAYWGEPDFLTFTPTPTTNGDWNCDGTLEKQYNASVSCGLVNLGQCDTTSGFTTDPACGVAAAFVQCHTNTSGLLCGVVATTMKTQGCR
jgi:hypothetical protein